MEQCRKSQPSTYLLGEINLSNRHMVCLLIQRQLPLVWVGLVRKIYTSIEQGLYLNLSLTQLLEWHKSFTTLIKTQVVIRTYTNKVTILI